MAAISAILTVDGEGEGDGVESSLSGRQVWDAE